MESRAAGSSPMLTTVIHKIKSMSFRNMKQLTRISRKGRTSTDAEESSDPLPERRISGLITLPEKTVRNWYHRLPPGTFEWVVKHEAFVRAQIDFVKANKRVVKVQMGKQPADGGKTRTVTVFRGKELPKITLTSDSDTAPIMSVDSWLALDRPGKGKLLISLTRPRGTRTSASIEQCVHRHGCSCEEDDVSEQTSKGAVSEIEQKSGEAEND